MRKFFSRIFLVAIFTMALLIPVSHNCFAEDFKFVDAEDNTGYYVDMDTIKIENQESITATIAVVKANLNKMYLYDVMINHKNQSYQIISSKILEYDTRNVLESNNRRRPFRPYSSKSEMSELINFILNGGELSN